MFSNLLLYFFPQSDHFCLYEVNSAIGKKNLLDNFVYKLTSKTEEKVKGKG